ncbi:hypothetical protein J3Q64DRAFT_1700580 [Phycomyces blakesleeanus]|uniref:Arrestin-like N-terminal domain-containing protein n=2 Tax=Phycomyces blakesleeanus TaxID=4837 RepID=A0A162U2C6_PHYB8|nr:hypothetical protein PHYBLDRAFT_65150 [Phycomyces blakesleeanus NRRL 1555(-)]OAD72922.1 hypothetical protein PHYBLDRAFT_65150 [Phycomyces blakesleeanus NRRL 1555(-)]|eukprot:XP_018290962.1 hypothetical protein PHYBLDRAFT_65150 [Phycomyces blakesleeanus NRRL 1555(-)]
MPNKEDATLSFFIDSSFKGIIYGLSNDESEGCTLKGYCRLTVNKPVRVRRLLVSFEGKSKINLKPINTVGVPSTEGVESRTLASTDTHFLGNDGISHLMEPGEYDYPFSFEISSRLPSSFHGKRGYISYQVQATLHRSLFLNNIVNSHPIVLRRCLINDLQPMLTTLRDTVCGEVGADILTYSASAPTMTFREGGLVRLNLSMQLVNPDTHVVKSVACALQERVHYHTTGQQSISCQITSKIDDSYPLGWSTFIPSSDSTYDPAELHHYNAIFRLCPRVNADNSSRLLKVSHSLVVKINVEEKNPTEIDVASRTTTPALSRTHSPAHSRTTTPPLSRTSSSSSLSSLHGMSHPSDTLRDAATKLSFLNLHPFQSMKPKSVVEPSTGTLCTLEIPLSVTTREHYWEGGRPQPPAYESAEAPPSYTKTLEQLPSAPIYDMC